MSSISCWTSATRCSNNLVSHPTSNSYPLPPLSIGPFIGGEVLPRYPFVCRAPIVRASPSIQDSVVGYVSLYQGAIWGVWVRAFDGGRRRHFEVDAMRIKGRFLWPTTGSYKHSIISFRFPRFICLCSLSLAYSVSAFYLTSTSPTRHAP